MGPESLRTNPRSHKNINQIRTMIENFDKGDLQCSTAIEFFNNSFNEDALANYHKDAVTSLVKRLGREGYSSFYPGKIGHKLLGLLERYVKDKPEVFTEESLKKVEIVINKSVKNKTMHMLNDLKGNKEDCLKALEFFSDHFESKDIMEEHIKVLKVLEEKLSAAAEQKFEEGSLADNVFKLYQKYLKEEDFLALLMPEEFDRMINVFTRHLNHQ